MRIPLVLALLIVPAFHALLSHNAVPCGGACYMPLALKDIKRSDSLTLALADTPAAKTADKPAPASGQPAPNELTGEEISQGWIKLFDGSTMFGWRPNNDVNWSIAGGVIQADTGKPGLLVTTVPFADYELRCDYRLAPGGNSGIFLRTQLEPGNIKTECYELNMCDSHDSFPTGSLVNRKKADVPSPGEGTWRTFFVTVDGRHITANLDGTRVLDYTDPNSTPHTGFIGLQKNTGKVEFRSVYVRPLGMKSLFNGKDLAGWRVVPGSKSKFDVNDQTIRVTGGRGFLETSDTYGDFILQADAISNGEGLNSGIFFRAIRGTDPCDGYECQIHNGFLEGDRAKPKDYGTGAIFNRSKARAVVSDDYQWFTLTLAAHGPHFAVWVNGQQVTDWTDNRPPNDNPRKGTRLKAGHLDLQGHDDTTNLAFRNLRIVTE